MIYRKVKGITSDGTYMKAAEVSVRFSSDAKGESLSFEADGILIGVPYEKIIPVIKKERAKKK